MAFLQYFSGSKRPPPRSEMYLYFPEKTFTFSTFSRHLDDLELRLTSAPLLRKQKKS